MNEFWHIPRASLASSSAASIASSTNRTHHSNSTNTSSRNSKVRNIVSEGTNSPRITCAATTAAAAAAVLAAAKRSSRSSQGSSDSIHSSRSTRSDSLLLTVANLERFTEIHRTRQHLSCCQQTLENLAAVHSTHSLQQQHIAHNIASESAEKRPRSEATTIVVDPNLDLIKNKDLDTLSIASSMHFTMVNGEAGSNLKSKRGLCDRGHQITVLIVSMSTLFMLLIMGMVFALEMRAREMSQS